MNCSIWTQYISCDAYYDSISYKFQISDEFRRTGKSGCKISTCKLALSHSILYTQKYLLKIQILLKEYIYIGNIKYIYDYVA